ncbi:nitrogenase component 1 [Desulfoferrobacter suflitae]|uniref:nitrogenase component 1 n=1 Tax=Desulfoferrobacter suflitae TaxID=2865782 RepID=UPI0021647963|nr:nitrogenase component 1 [Desulfoferrobacter suflitae]MCK8602524.1 nitrogenase [Desulfoferrobacter suflitae]
MSDYSSPYISTTNACKLCKPLGACLAFRGIEGAVPFLHGSQGCATYMRRYIISHFREPMDIASSSLGEKHAVYGGEANLRQGLQNVMKKFGARLVGVATTCLTETIGDDVPMILRTFKREMAEQGTAHQDLPAIVNVATPSYSGTHMEGFHAAVRAVVEQLAECPEDAGRSAAVNLLPGFTSPADVRYLQEIMADCGIPVIVLPDISETLDGPALDDYRKIPDGGTSLAEIARMGCSRATIELGRTLFGHESAGRLLETRFQVPLHRLGVPIGLRESDRLFEVLQLLAGVETPEKHVLERGRLIDAYVDGHKYTFGKGAVIYGEEDLVIGLTSFLLEIGVKPLLCASGGKSGRLREAIEDVNDSILPELPIIREGVDFYEIAEEAESLSPDLLLGHSKGYHLARRFRIPLIRVGFPIHDRFGGQRVLHLGYRGAQELFDRIVNALLDAKQEASPVGYGYM